MGNNFQGANIDLELTKFATAFFNSMGSFGANEVAPVIPTPDLKGTYKRNTNAHLRRHDTKRAPGTPSIRIKTAWTDADYKVYNHGAAEEITQDDRIAAEIAGINVEEEATMAVVSAMRIDREASAMSVLTNATAHTAVGHYAALAGANRWDTATGNPFKDLREMRLEVFDGCGMPPNLITMPWDVWVWFSENDEFLARLGSLNIAEPSPEALGIMLGKKEMFGRDAMPYTKIVILSAVENTFVEAPGETAANNTFSSLMNNSVVASRVESGVTILRKDAITAFATFELERYQGFEMKIREDEEREVTIVEGGWYYNTVGIDYECSSQRATVIS